MTTKRQTLLDLAARVEGLDGPSREVDACIAHAIAWRWDGWVDGDVEIEQRAVESVIDRTLNSHNSIFKLLPTYTASLDAAMQLVPPDYDWILARTNGGLTIHAEVGDREQIFGNTPALALCSAALRARAMMDPQDEN